MDPLAAEPAGAERDGGVERADEPGAAGSTAKRLVSATR